MTDVLRTPDERFEGVPDFPWQPDYVGVDVGGTPLRLARVDEGDGHPVVLLHGEPTWGFLYRQVIPPLLEAGHRVVVPDHPGFGRSDKPTDPEWFTYDRLVESLDAHLLAAGIDQPCTLVVHDWGGPIGLRWATENSDRVAALVILDTGLYAPGGEPSEDWLDFRRFVEDADELPIGFLVDGGAVTDLGEDVVAAYEAPFHTPASQAGARMLPLLVPLSDDDPGADAMWTVNRALNDWRAPTYVLWGADDPILPPSIGAGFASRIPGAGELDTVSPAGHFLQEDAGPEIGGRIGEFIAARVL